VSPRASGPSARRASNGRDPGPSVNDGLATQLEEIADLLRDQGANPFRVKAYRQAGQRLRQLREPVTRILATDGPAGLQRLPGIGESLARTIQDILRLGRSPMRDRLRGDTDPVHLFATVPGVGRRLAARLHDELDLETLEDLEAAAVDGRLARLGGFGPKRVAGIRAALAERLGRVRLPASEPQPDVAELLDVDREYREAAAGGRLPRVAPRRFNPTQRAWLPILHTARGDRHYTALFSNTARAHRLDRTDDWVVIYLDDGRAGGQWTVVTARGGGLRGQRVVRGRELECARLQGFREA
jgi:putative hydrolase